VETAQTMAQSDPMVLAAVAAVVETATTLRDAVVLVLSLLGI
jgi:hypothetical protein